MPDTSEDQGKRILRELEQLREEVSSYTGLAGNTINRVINLLEDRGIVSHEEAEHLRTGVR